MSTRIDADLLFDGYNEPIKSGTVVFENGKITYVGTQEGAPNAQNSVVTKTVMPGLWDCHTHFMGLKGASSLEWIKADLDPISTSARATYDALRAIESGFTSVREVGGVGLKLRDAIKDNSIIGPNIYSAGHAIGVTGGHSDSHEFPLDFVHEIQKRYWSSTGPVDGPWEAVKSVRVQFREGADLIKIMGSGGVMSQRDSPHHQEFQDEELKAIVREANMKDRIVAAHCHGAAGMKACLNAGIKTIEHGTWMDEEIADLMIEKDAILVPTIFIQLKLHENGRKFGASDLVMDKIAEVVKQHRSAMKMAYKKGVKIAMGTDIYSSGPDSMVPWGENARELQYYVEDIGMSTLEALRTSTYMGPFTLGPRAPKSGMLKQEYNADIICIDGDPLSDIKILQDKSKITKVYKFGKLQKSKLI